VGETEVRDDLPLVLHVTELGEDRGSPLKEPDGHGVVAVAAECESQVVQR
jgi:hypothetical protein